VEIDAGPRLDRTAPFWFELVRRLPYGRDRALNYLRNAGALDRIANFPFHDRSVAIPLDEQLLRSYTNLNHYQYRRICTFSRLCNKYLGQFDFFDCGAHVGLFSVQFTQFSSQVTNLTAIEPNPRLFPILQKNLQEVRVVKVKCVQAAVADFEGRGRLTTPDYDSGTEAMHLVEDPSGDVNVVTLTTALNDKTQPRAAIKIDIEGYEVPVLRSAAEAIRSLDSVLIFVELNKSVLRRIGMSDLDMLHQIEAIRPFSWVNATDGKPIDSRCPIFDQVNLPNQCDVIGIELGER
jgi:FkbM family methyltransferase